MSDNNVTIEDIDTQFAEDNSNEAAAVEFDIKPGDEHGAPAKKPRVVRTDEERAKLAEIREKSRVERQARAEERKKLRETAQPRHSAKLDKAAEALPVLTEEAQQAFDDASVNLSQNDIVALIAHLAHHVRSHKTSQSRELKKLAVGDKVVVTGTAVETLKWLGREGTISRSQSIHVMVDIDGDQAYLYRSDVELVESAIDIKTANG